MKVLFLLPEAPYPPDRGPRHHTYGLLQIAARRYKCDVAGFYRGTTGLVNWRQLETMIPELQIQAIFPETAGIKRFLQGAVHLVCLQPLVLRGYASAAFSGWLDGHLLHHNYDLVYIDQFKLAYYWSHCRGIPVLLVPYDAFSLKSYRAFKAAKSLKVKAIAYYLYRAFARLETQLYHHFSVVSPVSQIDAQWLKQRDSRIHTEVIEIPVAEEFLAYEGQSPTSKEPHIICAGLVSSDGIAQGAIRFLKEAVPLIKQAIPNAQITLWGANPIPALRKVLETMPDVRHVGWVENYMAMLQSAWVYVYPQACGAGIQTKVQQAMAMGIPVVARPETLAPLYAVSEKHAYMCQHYPEMANVIIRLLTNAALRKRIGIAANTHIRAHFSLDAIAPKVYKVCQNIKK